MRSNPVSCIFLIFLCFFVWAPQDCMSSSKAPSSGVIKWYPYDEGIALGLKEKKDVFLNFYANWCGYCKKMDNGTFKDSSVVAYLNENFISIKVNSDKEKRIASAYYVSGLPTSWFISKDGEKISNLPGYVPADMLMNILKYIYTDSYKKMNFRKFLDNM